MLPIKTRYLAVIGLAVIVLSLLACGENTRAGISVKEGVPFCTIGQGGSKQTLLLDIAQPKGQTQALPVVLMVHGGGWSGGSRADYRYMIEAIAQQGMVGVSIDYRLAPQSVFPAQLQDVKCAVRWIRENAATYQMDTKRVVAMGGSAGAHLVALLGSTAGMPEFEGTGGHANQSSRIDAMVLHAGPYDLGRVVRQVQAQPMAESNLAVQAVQNLLGGNNDPESKSYRLASPATYVNQKTVPTLLMHGRKDTLVPFSEAVQMHALLQSKNVPSKLILIDDAGHGDYGSNPGPVVLDLIAFFKGQ